MTNPYISIVIPVYNGENYLRHAIDSVLAQDYDNYEVIVVNDGSTDSTEEICLSYKNKIRYYSKVNGGVSSALNLGIQNMRGDYFTWLAHDDQFYPEKLRLQINALKAATDQTAIVHGNYNLLNVTYNTLSSMRQEDSYRIGQLTNSVFPLLMTSVHASTPLIHKSHFERVGTFDEALPLTQDYDFLFRAMRGRRSVFISKPLLMTRLHGLSEKNANQRFGLACSEQYEHFSDSLTYEEVCDMFPSPRAFYLRMAAMIKARHDTPASDKLLLKIKTLPEEQENTALAKYLYDCFDGKAKNLCIFGTGYHGKVLKYELEHRKMKIDCFCDNNDQMHGILAEGLPCVSPKEILHWKDKMVIVIAADVSDVIETQLKALGFPHITTKKTLDSLILETPPAI